MPGVVTVIGLVVSPLLQSKVPVKLVAVKVEVPSQLFTTRTVGAVGVVFGSAVTKLLDGLIHPSTICLTP